MYQIDFTATNSADWAQAIEIYDATDTQCGGDPLVPEDAVFELAVTDRGRHILGGSTENGRITRPSPDRIQWIFTVSELRVLKPRNTYKVGLTIATAGGTTQLLIGTLSFLDGVVRP